MKFLQSHIRCYSTASPSHSSLVTERSLSLHTNSSPKSTYYVSPCHKPLFPSEFPSKVSQTFEKRAWKTRWTVSLQEVTLYSNLNFLLVQRKSLTCPPFPHLAQKMRHLAKPVFLFDHVLFSSYEMWYIIANSNYLAGIALYLLCRSCTYLFFAMFSCRSAW